MNLKKFLSIGLSLLVFNSFVLNDYSFAFGIGAGGSVSATSVSSTSVASVSAASVSTKSASSIPSPVSEAAHTETISPEKIYADLSKYDNFKITDYFISEKNKDKTIIFIQDLHTSPFVQKNIADIIETINKTYKTDCLFVEGLPAHGSIGQKNEILKDIKKYNISDELLKDNLLTGPEYFLLNNDKDVKIYGLEDFDIYLKNIERAAQILQDREYIKETFENFRKTLYRKIPEAKKLQKYINFDLSDIKLLAEINRPVTKYVNLYNYLSVLDNIKKLNFKKVKEEHKKFLKDLKQNLKFGEYKKIMDFSLQENGIKYYSLLHGEITKEQYKNKYDNLKKFLEFQIQKNGLNILSFISEKEMYFNDFLNFQKSENTKNSQKSERIFVLKMTDLFDDFLNLSISYDEYKFFANNYQRYINLLSKYLAQDYYKYSDLLFYDIVFDYHRVNVERNNIFIRNILDELNNGEKPRIITAAAGGFHSSILKEIKKRNISYILITPEINGSIGTQTYNDILLSSLKDYQKSALAPVRIISAKMSGVPLGIKAFFFEQVIKRAFKNSALFETENYKAGKKEYTYEEIKTAIKVIAEEFFNGGVEVPVEFSVKDSEDKDGVITVTVRTDNGNITFDLNQKNFLNQTASTGQKAVTAQKPSRKLSDKLVSAVRALFGIYEAEYMKLNPKSIYFSGRFGISQRLGLRYNFMFSLSMLFNFLHFYDMAYDLMIGFASTKTESKTYTINFDTDFGEDGQELENLRGFRNLKGKTIDVIVEKELAYKIGKEEIIKILKAAIRRTGSKIGKNTKKTLFIGMLDKSTNLFEDHLNNGFIGVNEGVAHIEDEVVRRALMQAGLIHEFSHELHGPLGTKTLEFFEEKMMFADIKFIIEYVVKAEYGDDADITGIIFNDELYSRIIDRIERALISPINTDGQPLFSQRVRFIRKLKGYKYNIKDIADFLRRKDFSIDDRRGQLEHIEDEYLVKHPELQTQLFSKMIEDKETKQSLEEFFADNIDNITKERRAEVEEKINSLIENLKTMLKNYGLKPKELEEKAEEFKKLIYGCLKIMYHEMPSYIFAIFYNEQGVVADHSLNHSLELLNSVVEILKKEASSETDIRQVDFKTIVFAAFFHDISCSLLRLNHEQNSAIWTKTVLTEYMRSPKDYMDKDEEISFSAEEIEKIYQVCLGHRKAKNGTPRKEHTKYYEARLVHDADGLAAALDLKRILGVWLRMGERFFDEQKTIEAREKLIKENKYLQSDGGDAVNDLLRQFIRRDPRLYLTAGARRIIEESKSNLYAIQNMLLYDKDAEALLRKYNMYPGEEQMNKILSVLDDVLKFFNKNSYKKFERVRIKVSKKTPKTDNIKPRINFEIKSIINFIANIFVWLFSAKKFDTTFVSILEESSDLYKTEDVYLKGVNAAAVSHIDNIRIDTEVLGLQNIQINGVPVRIKINRIKTVNKALPVISFEYDGDRDMQLEQDIAAYIIEQIKNNGYKGFIKFKRNVFVNGSLNKRLQKTGKNVSRKLISTIRSSFGDMQELYDLSSLNAVNVYNIKNSDMNIVKDLLSAA